MTFQPLTEPIDYVLLAGQRSPGICDVLAADSPRRWDERRGYGLSGATLVYRGAGLSHPRLMLRLYTDQDWADWHAWGTLVMREPWPDAAAIERRARQAEATQQELSDLQQAIAVNPSLGNDSAVTNRLSTLSSRSTTTPLTALRRPRALDIWHPILEDLGITSVVVENTLQPVQTGNGEWTIEVRLIEHRAPVFALARPEGSEDAPRDRFEEAILDADAQNQALRDRRDALAGAA